MKEDNSSLLDTNKLENDLERSKEDVIHTLTKAGLNLIPIAGGSAVELFNEVIAPPISKRRDQWLITIANAINGLENQIEDFKIENLSENEIFITVIMHASQIAIRNHQKEKLTALKNAVLNSALENAPEEDLQLIFLDLVDSFTALHLKLLKFFNEPKFKEFIDILEYNAQNRRDFYMSFNLEETLEFYFPELKGKKHIYEQVLKDLKAKGMIENHGYVNKTTGVSTSQILDLGEMFLLFIISPL